MRVHIDSFFEKKNNDTLSFRVLPKYVVCFDNRAEAFKLFEWLDKNNHKWADGESYMETEESFVNHLLNGRAMNLLFGCQGSQSTYECHGVVIVPFKKILFQYIPTYIEIEED